MDIIAKKPYDIEVCNEQDVTKPIRIVNKQELRKHLPKDIILPVVSGIKNINHQTILYTLFYTGVRVTELISINKEHIDFEHNTIRIRHLKSRKYYERIIPIRKEVVFLLKSYTSTMKYNDRVFPVTRQHVHRLVQKYFKVHGDYGPHMLRHSFAILFIQESKSPMGLMVLQRLLGHKHIQTTMEYLKLVPNDLAIELDKINFN